MLWNTKARSALLVALLSGLSAVSCLAPKTFASPKGLEPLTTEDLTRYAVIPRPRVLQPAPGHFVWTAETRIVAPSEAAAHGVAQYLAELVATPTGFKPQLEEGSAAKPGAVSLRLDPSVSEDEGYRLTVDASSVDISANSVRGLFYGVQTLRQLLPTALDSTSKAKLSTWEVPAVHVEDAPRFAYRGMHLDVGRHFFPAPFIKQYIDWLARYKFNTFHWHLTDDQGWRIEIKQYPKLTEVGGYRKETLIGHSHDLPAKFDGTRYGGFYTQEQIKDVVSYATSRFVTIVPEIEMPGHSLAAIAAYPELACSPGAYEVGTKWGIFEDILCPKEETFTFLQNVLGEVIELFPGPYVHVGGDEAPKARWRESELVQRLKAEQHLTSEDEVQSYFIKRIDDFLNSKQRKLVGWDEILAGGLSPNAVVMSWRGFDGGTRAAQLGHSVIMTPHSFCYFDQYQASPGAEPLAIGGQIPVEKVYAFEPVPIDLPADQRHFVIGAQGSVWTEYMATPDQVEYMVFPRLLALSETIWSPAETRNYPSFVTRLRPNAKRLQQLGIKVAPHVLD